MFLWFYSEQESIPISLNQCNRAFLFLIPVLVAAIQLCLQGSADKSLLETHSTNIYAFLFTTIIFGFAFTMANTNFSQSQFFCVIAFITGSLSLVYLVSVIVPHWCTYTIFILWAFGSFIVVYGHVTVIMETYNWLLQKSKKVYEKINSWWRG
ncbi:hypothetical protein Patl1_00204 [Pistacia atlantica]|uniref:Uncharacterized protein n=1 Tax=Pistacia atlantica TaxID=434234 RepID=A0ACC1C7H0_9ROSI|nr:hypothetical protein Patl1_00204 [Pistacia atlantica]